MTFIYCYERIRNSSKFYSTAIFEVVGVCSITWCAEHVYHYLTFSCTVSCVFCHHLFQLSSVLSSRLSYAIFFSCSDYDWKVWNMIRRYEIWLFFSSQMYFSSKHNKLNTVWSNDLYFKVIIERTYLTLTAIKKYLQQWSTWCGIIV